MSKEKYTRKINVFSDMFFESVATFKVDSPLRKMMIVILLFSLSLWSSGLGPQPGLGYTVGYYQDAENTKDNTFTAGEVDFILNASEFSPTTTAISLSPGDITIKNIDVDPQISNPFKYIASTTNVYGDLDFCGALSVGASLEGEEVYDGDLLEMLTESTTTLDSWEFVIGMGSNNFQNSICNFDTEYSGSQTRNELQFGEGFSDVEVEGSVIASWGFRINKVYYDVAPDRGEEVDNEWVEIYNQTNLPLSIDGWEICDNLGCDTLSASEDIPAGGYGFIVASSTTASNILPAFWYLPADVALVEVLDGSIGNGLNNDSDMLLLKRPDGIIIDQMNWGTPNDGWANWNEDVWNPGIPDADEGNALTRVPSGYDTNEPSDFTELIPPSIDLIYPDEAGSYTWYWGYSYTIEWEAFNNNGLDEDLNIKIFYVKDVNGDDEVSEGDIMLTIAETTANTGEYDWTVPSGFIGYIWIYIVGIAPENPMLNSGTISGGIWDPIPLFIGSSEDEALAELEALDNEAPVIIINGNNPALIELGSTYNDLGAMVTDNVNLNLGVSTNGFVDASVVGEYQIVYTAVDQAGNITEEVRTVIVYDPLVGPPVIEETVIEEAPTLEEMLEEVIATTETSTTTEPVVEEIIPDNIEEPLIISEIITTTSNTTEAVAPEVETGTSTEPVAEEPVVEVVEGPVYTHPVEPEVVSETSTSTDALLEEVLNEEVVATSTEGVVVVAEAETSTTTEEALVEEIIIEEPVVELAVEPVAEGLVVEAPPQEPISDLVLEVVTEPAIVEDPIIEPVVEEEAPIE